MTLYAHLADGGEAEDGTGGFREEVVYIVDGLTGPKETWLDAALNAVGLPGRYQPHRSRPGAVVTRRVARQDGPTSARISISYGVLRGTEVQQPPDVSAGVIEVGATVTTEVVSRDIENKSIFVTYDKQVRNLLGNIVTVADVQGREVERQTAQMVLRRTRIETTPPVRKAQRFVGTVNNFAIWGFGRETLLCTGITGRSSDNGLTYEVEYNFQHNRKGWLAEVYYILAETNAPPTDLVDGYGRKVVRVQETEAFNQIGVSF